MTTTDQTLVFLKALAIYKTPDGEHVMIWLDSDQGKVLATLLAAYPTVEDAMSAAQRTIESVDDIDSPTLNVDKQTGQLATGMLVLRTTDTDLPEELPCPCLALAVHQALSIVAAVPADVVAPPPDHSTGEPSP